MQPKGSADIFKELLIHVTGRQFGTPEILEQVGNGECGFAVKTFTPAEKIEGDERKSQQVEGHEDGDEQEGDKLKKVIYKQLTIVK